MSIHQLGMHFTPSKFRLAIPAARTACERGRGTTANLFPNHVKDTYDDLFVRYRGGNYQETGIVRIPPRSLASGVESNRENLPTQIRAVIRRRDETVTNTFGRRWRFSAARERNIFRRIGTRDAVNACKPPRGYSSRLWTLRTRAFRRKF